MAEGKKKGEKYDAMVGDICLSHSECSPLSPTTAYIISAVTFIILG